METLDSPRVTSSSDASVHICTSASGARRERRSGGCTSASATRTGRLPRGSDVSVRIATSASATTTTQPIGGSSNLAPAAILPLHRKGGRPRQRPGAGPSNAIQLFDAPTSRLKRRRLLDQHRMVWGGVSSVRSANLECGQFDQVFVDALKGPASYVGRSYYGPPDYQCSSCGALFWYAERVGKESYSTGGRVIYNNCCRGGKVVIPRFLPWPEPLATLARYDGGPVSNKFIKNIRQYNCLFSFTSMGANIDRSMNDGTGPPIFKICGQVHHRIGSLLPSDGEDPKFIQLYIYDTANEVQNRIRSLDHHDSRSSELDPTIVHSLIQMLDEHNPLAKQFRMARDRLALNESEDFVIRIIGP